MNFIKINFYWFFLSIERKIKNLIPLILLYFNKEAIIKIPKFSMDQEKLLRSDTWIEDNIC